MTHWAEKYIGEPWTAVDNNCWAFVRRVWAEQFALAVPEIDADACNTLACVRELRDNAENHHWVAVGPERQLPGDAVLMGRSRQPSHIGIYTGQGILHCMRGPGVIHSRAPELWVTGLRVLGYYRRAA